MTPPTPVSRIPENLRENLAEHSERLESATPQEIIAWAAQELGEGLVLSSSFGADAVAMLHIVSQVAPTMRVAFLDTGWHFPETLLFRREVEQRFGLNIVDLVVEGGHDRFRDTHGELWRTSTDACCNYNKVEPWRKFLIEQGCSGWLAGLRRESGGVRAKVAILEPSIIVDPVAGSFELLKIHPVANWTKKQLWGYIMANELPYHPLADQGYPSIGCWPCTRAVKPGEDERAGRWAGEAKTECGLHLMSAPQPPPAS